MRYTLLFLSLLFFALTFFPFSASAVECDSCADCSSKLLNNTYLELNTSISNNTATCIESITSKENITIDCNGYSITSTGSLGNGIYILYGSNITVVNCIIEGFQYGLTLQDITGSSNLVSNVTANRSSWYGLVLRYASNVSIESATIANCGAGSSSGAGIYMYSSNYANITQSAIHSNKYGVRIIHDSDHNTITENTITGNNKTGIYMAQSLGFAPDNNTITANRIRNNAAAESPKYEINIGADCANNNITGNALKHAISDSGNDTVVSGNIYSDFIVGPASLFITDFSTIAGAITGASPYSLVHVMSGTYSECIAVNKSLHLRGESRANTSINCCVFGLAAAEIKSDDVNLSEFTINATSGIALQAEDVSNITIEKNLLVGGLGSLEFSNVTNSTAKSNNITDAVLLGKDTQQINISYNFFSGLFLLKSINNNLWMNNFTDSDNEYYQNENDYCVFGLDNRYHESIIDDPPLSCIAEFYNRFNDTAVYANETILFSANTSFGESNYTAINVTINSTNYTLELTAGDNVDGLWTYAFNETVEVGQYVATMLHYIEADDDEGAMGIYYVNFTVSKLNMTTVLNTTIANVTDTIFMEANTTGNATPIENVLAEIYWNGSIKDSTNMTLQSCSGALKDRCRYTLDYNNTERSGNYTVNMTVFAGKTKTNTEEFFVNYGYAEVMLEEMPQLVENGTTTTQWYTITAVGGDLANITSAISINDTTVLNITAAENTTKNTSYIFNKNSTALVWQIEGKSIGTAELNVTTSTANNIAGESKEIWVTSQGDTEAPNVTAVWTQYEEKNSQLFNLNDTMAVYANVTDAYNIDSVKANITLPDSTSIRHQ